jgi:hypothetical protein
MSTSTSRRTTSESFLVDLVAYLQCVYPLSRELPMPYEMSVGDYE